ncbi:hypothetical protein ACCUM_0132 [Candidatus Accumulibacter phosphatis]|uniref:Uncharacterized protein n=1 Tax=Candidatus Accumulibacter phosphatis TaxID=327160 RepID=A0A5S4EL35_9PROT|nr:hypothetical protein ACCUM_0132 [Candidatus Accumulibacter phosphatis]
MVVSRFQAPGRWKRASVPHVLKRREMPAGGDETFFAPP